MVIKMRYAVDEIIDSVVKLENIETGDIMEGNFLEKQKCWSRNLF